MILTLFKIFILSWFITNFDPFKQLLNQLLLWFSILFKNTIIGQRMYLKIAQIIIDVFDCLKCCSFWTGLILTGNIYTAATAAFIGYIYNRNFSITKFK